MGGRLFLQWENGYIIAGAADCILGNRLSASSQHTVLQGG